LPSGLGAAPAFSGAGADRVALNIGQAAEYREHQAPGRRSPSPCRCFGCCIRRPAWLGEQPATVQDLKAILAPYPSDEMICWPVSPRVGNVKNKTRA
jgi:hypothetical protein